MRIFIIFIITFFCEKNIFSQINSSISFGFIGTDTSSSLITSGTLSVDMTSCYNIANGIFIFLETGNGPFSALCTTSLNDTGKIIMSLFPNPFIEKFFIKASSTFSSLDPNESIGMSIITYNGQEVRRYSYKMQDLLNGISLNIGALIPGIYIVNISTSKNTMALRVIKSSR
jgi:hypothetical protein